MEPGWQVISCKNKKILRSAMLFTGIRKEFFLPGTVEVSISVTVAASAGGKKGIIVLLLYSKVIIAG